jgi:hypothetical protein
MCPVPAFATLDKQRRPVHVHQKQVGYTSVLAPRASRAQLSVDTSAQQDQGVKKMSGSSARGQRSKMKLGVKIILVNLGSSFSTPADLSFLWRID